MNKETFTISGKIVAIHAIDSHKKPIDILGIKPTLHQGSYFHSTNTNYHICPMGGVIKCKKYDLMDVTYE